MDKTVFPAVPDFRMTKCAATLVLCALCVSPIALTCAQAAPTGVNQNAPGLADTPGTRSSVSYSKPLSENSLKLQDGLAQIDSDMLLKVYFYAYSGTPVDYSAILTANTENIVPPKPAQPGNDQKKVIDRLIQNARAHPDILIKVDDIALDAYDMANQSFPIVNRLFIDGTHFYFDNSPYHYYYSDTAAFHTLHCADGKTIATINSAVANYEHFSMDIIGHVSHAVAREDALVIDLRKVVLKTALGDPLITQVKQ
ncbi:MAG: hypothetical protein PHZ14_11920 [Sulfuricella sp.]|nr:hypothetical protein [Sulfuricella sp.]